MAEINKEDIVSNEALQVPLELAENLQKVLDVLNKLIVVGKQASESIGKSSSSGKVKKETEGITEAQKELDKISKQLATTQAKNNEEYRKQSESLNKLKKDLRDTAVLGDQDAKSVTAQTNSRKQLGVALEKNKQAYSNLTSEEARNSKAGKELLSIIQRQDKEYKHLSDSIKETKVHVGDYAKATESLNGLTGGLVERTKLLGQQFLALAKNPVVLILSALVGTFIALKSSVTAFFTTTAEGEEKLSRQKATWDAFFITLKQGWADVGKSVFDFFGENGLKGLFDTFLLMYFPSLWAKFQITEKRSQKLNAALRKLTKDHAEDIVDDANTELKANKLIEVSRNKLDFSAEQRMAALKEHNKIKNKQLEGDIQLAKDDLAAFDQRIKLERKNGEMMLADITERARLQAALIKVESDASAARTGFLKLEKALSDEIHKDDVERLTNQIDAELAAKEAEVEKAVNLIRQEVIEGHKIKADGDKEINQLRKAMADDLIQAQIEGLEKLMKSTVTTAEEDAEIAKKIAKLKIDLNQAVYDQVITLDEATVESGKSTLDQIAEAYEEFSNSITQIFSQGSDKRIDAIDTEIEKLNEQLAVDLKNAGDNDAFKANLEKNAEKRRAELEAKKNAEKRKQFVADKLAATIDSTIKTAQAYMVQLASPPAITAIPRAIAAGILGTIQTLAIATKPIPKFATGVKNFEGGPAIVGERGSELVRVGGNLSLTPSSSTLVNLPKGADVLPHDHKDTMRALAMQSLGQEVFINMENAALYSKFESIEQTTKKYSLKIVKAILSTGGNIRKQGSILYAEQKRHDGSVNLIRLKNVSK